MSLEPPTRGLIPWFASNPVAANLLMVLVIALGVLSLGSLRKEAFPTLEPDQVTVTVSYDSGSARQTEEGITIKIEEALEDVLGVDTITSTSSGTSATVTVEKQEGYDLDTLMRDVKAKVDAINNLPVNADKPVIKRAQREHHAISLQLYGDVGRRTLQRLADELKADLLTRDAISQVSVSGGLDPMMVVSVDEGHLQALGLSLSDVEDAVNEGSSDTMTAVISNADIYLQLKASNQAYYEEEFAAIPLVTAADGTLVRLGDVATIDDTFDDQTAVLSRFDDHDSLSLEVISTGRDDITRSADAALDVAQEWQTSGRLPASVHLAVWNDHSESIRDRLRLLVENALQGIALVFLLLALFLNVTVAFWVAAGLPFIFFGTLFFMGDGFAALTLNGITTFGFIMALGIVVDDAVVIGESVYTTRARDGDTLANTIRGTMRVAVPTLFGVLTTVAAFVSLTEIRGHLGQLYSQFAAVVAICLILSLVESKLILPAHLAHLNTTRRPTRNVVAWMWQRIQQGADTGLFWCIERVYRPVIEWSLRFRYTVIVLFVALFVAVIAMPFTGALRVSFFPHILGDTVRASLTMRNDASFGQTHAALRLLESRAHETDRALRGVADGAPDPGPSAIANLQLLSVANQSGRITVELAPGAPYDIDDFTRAWRQRAGLPEGAKSLEVRNSPEMVDALRIELRAADDESLSAAGAVMRQRLSAFPAVNGLETNLDPGQPQLFMALTPLGHTLGLTTTSLAQQVLQAFHGQVVQRFQRDNDEVEVRVRYPDPDRQTSGDVLNARVRTPDGEVLPLSSVATVTSGFTRESITRIDGERAVYLSADVDKDITSSTDLVAALRADVVPILKRQYPSVSIKFAGEAEEQAETETSMAEMFGLTLLVIYMMLAIPLKSYIQPVLIMTAIPFGIVGAMLGHWISGLAISVLSLNGIIALAGVVVNDSLLLTATFNDVRERVPDAHAAISEACRGRVRAVLLTSLTTAGGLLPLLAETSVQAQFLIPAAVSLAYGILFATVITLILIPSLLMIAEDGAAAGRWVRRKLKGGGDTVEAEVP